MIKKLSVKNVIALFSALYATAALAQAELTPVSEELSDELYKHYLRSKPDPFKGKVKFCLDKPNAIVPGLVSFVGGINMIEGNTVFVFDGCRIPLYQCGKDGTIRQIEVRDYSDGNCPVTYRK